MKTKIAFVCYLILTIVLSACNKPSSPSGEGNFVKNIKEIEVNWNNKEFIVNPKSQYYELIQEKANNSVKNVEGICKCIKELDTSVIKHYEKSIVIHLKKTIDMNMPIQAKDFEKLNVSEIVIPFSDDEFSVSLGENALSKYNAKQDDINKLKDIVEKFVESSQ